MSDSLSDRLDKLSPARLKLLAMTLQRKVDAFEGARREPIAVVGMGCRFPGGANDPASFWSLMTEGRDAVGQMPADRWDAESLFAEEAPTPGKYATREAGFLEGVPHDAFDAPFFGIAPREASHLDPQQRLTLEVAWEALEDAQIPPLSLKGTQTAVYMGILNSDYIQTVVEETTREDIDVYTGSGNALSFPAGRLSYVLGTHGPSMVVATACSSSLVTVHLAIQALRGKQCDLALAGGVSLMLSPRPFIMLSQMTSLAPDGRCKTFDASANGYGRGEGCGILVLERLSDAKKAGRRVLAVLRGSAVNHGGPSGGLTVPNGPAQQKVIRAALEDAGVAPADVGYVETHGTGTSLGDPIEVQAIAAVLGDGRPADRPIRVGAVKTNIGHTEAAAGAAGLIKAVLALRNGQIPATLHQHTPNPKIPFAELNVAVVARPTPWGEQPRIAGVSSFGLSGINAHVLLEAHDPAPAEAAVAPAAMPVPLLPISARSEPALRELARRYAARIDAAPHELAAICADAAHGRSPLPVRAAVAARTAAEMATRLRAFADEQPAPGLVTGAAPSGRRSRLVFVFPGQGSQWLGMGRRLMAEHPAFRASLEATDAAFATHQGWSIREQLLADTPLEGLLDRPDYVQRVLFAMYVGLAAVWRSWGVEPDAVVGHSQGEAAAAHVSGALALEDAVAVVAHRSRLMASLPSGGGMASVELSVEEAEEAVRGRAGISVCASNSPRSTVIGGLQADLDAVLAELEGRGIFCRRVRVDFAAHSPQVEPLMGPLSAALASVRPTASKVPMFSTVTGEAIPGERLGAGYWVQNMRAPVRFWKATEALLEDGHDLFLEVSPHPVLAPAIANGLTGTAWSATTIASGRRDEDEAATLATALGALFAAGRVVDWSRTYVSHRSTELPTYPWQRQRYWFTDVVVGRKVGGEQPRLLGAEVRPVDRPDTAYFQSRVSVDAFPWLADHKVDGTVVFPGAGYPILALDAAARFLGDGPHAVRDLRLAQMLALPEEGRDLQVVLSRAGEFRILSRSGSDWTEHATGRVEAATPARSPDLAAARTRCTDLVTAEAHYARAAADRLDYGLAFRGIQAVHRRDGEVVAEVALPREAGTFNGVLHPALLDACMQALAATVRQADGTWLPTEVDQVVVHGAPTATVTVHGVLREDTVDRRVSDLVVVGSDGHVVARIEGLGAARLVTEADPLDRFFYHMDWAPAAAPGARDTQPGHWLLLADGPLGDRLLGALDAAGQRATLLSSAAYLADEASLEASLGRIAADGDPLRGVVHLWSEAPAAIDVDAALAREVRVGPWAALALIKALARRQSRDAPRVWLVTRGAQRVASEPVPNTIGGTLWGLGRSVHHEHAELQCSMVDLAPSPEAGEVDQLIAELLAGEREDQVCLRDGARHVARLHRTKPVGEAGAVVRPRTLSPAGARRFRLTTDAPGIFENLVYREVSDEPIGDEEVEIAVRAASLNFLDVLKAMGICPGQVGDPVLGGECAGIVTRVGAGVTGFTPGDEVVACAPNSFASHTRIRAEFVAPKPPSLTFAEAASIPVVYMTAHYAFEHRARLRRGDKVLIHSATGGTGMAAMALARRVGAEIWATAGSEEKRGLLRSWGVTHVYDSRSVAFASQILEETQGKGLDVVLNSLTGEAVEKGIEVLGHYGRFLEIGKKDIYDANRIGLYPFRKNLSYMGVDLAGMTETDPARFSELLREVLAMFAAGEIPAPQIQTWRAEDVVDAFRTMAQARHIGKLVVTYDQPDQVPIAVSVDEALASTGAKIRRDGVYLITGGLGGLGLVFARWLADEGATDLVLVGRSAPSETASATIASLRARGVRVLVARADVAKRDELAAVLATARDELGPLRGVVHSAGVLDDAVVVNLNATKLARVFAPKVLGAWNLHLLTRDHPLDLFVLFSSATALVGSPGQANYAAANGFLDALARHRRSLGLAGVSIQWGAFSEVGLAAAEALRGERVADRGARSLTPDDGVAAMRRMLGTSHADVGVVDLDVRQWREFYLSVADAPFLTDLASGATETRGGGALRGRLEAMAPGQRFQALLTAVTETVADVIRLPVAAIHATTPFTEFGLDSLMALELRNRLEATTGLTLSTTLVFAYPTVRDLAQHLGEQLGVLRGAEEAPPARDQSEDEQAAIVETLAEMSEEDAEALLAAKLAAFGEDF